MIALFLFALYVIVGSSYRLDIRMRLDPQLAKSFPRDFRNIPIGTDYGKNEDSELNHQVEKERLTFLEKSLFSYLDSAVMMRKRPIFTTALIAGDNVILDALAKLNLLERVPVIFIDTFTLFPETLLHLREVENFYGFTARRYHAADCRDQQEYYTKYGRDYWMKDIDKYDLLCKVEPMNRALKEHDSDCWINGRRRDHGAERAALPVWEGKKVREIVSLTST